MNSTTQSPKSSTDPNQSSQSTQTKAKAVKYFEKLGRINLWTGVEGVKQLRWESQQHRKNREAEESHARKSAWGASGDMNADADMGDVYLGDITEQHYHREKPGSQSSGSGVAKSLAAMGLAAAGIGAGIGLPIAAWNLTRKTPATTQQLTDTDTDTQYGLRIYRDESNENGS